MFTQFGGRFVHICNMSVIEFPSTGNYINMYIIL